MKQIAKDYLSRFKGRFIFGFGRIRSVDSPNRMKIQVFISIPEFLSQDEDFSTTDEFCTYFLVISSQHEAEKLLDLDNTQL